jgi:hypothetical protein
MKIVIFEKDGKNLYAKFGKGFTVKLAKEFIESFGYKIIFAGAYTEKTMDKIYNTGAEYIRAESLTCRFIA